jgi:hypothetical protein
MGPADVESSVPVVGDSVAVIHGGVRDAGRRDVTRRSISVIVASGSVTVQVVRRVVPVVMGSRPVNVMPAWGRVVTMMASCSRRGRSHRHQDTSCYHQSDPFHDFLLARVECDRHMAGHAIWAILHNPVRCVRNLFPPSAFERSPIGGAKMAPETIPQDAAFVVPQYRDGSANHIPTTRFVETNARGQRGRDRKCVIRRTSTWHQSDYSRASSSTGLCHTATRAIRWPASSATQPNRLVLCQREKVG